MKKKLQLKHLKSYSLGNEEIKRKNKILRPLSNFDDKENTRYFWLGVILGVIIGILI